MRSSKVKRQSVFISGSYRSRWDLPGVIWNIFKAWRCGRKLVRQGYSVFIPHLNTALMDDLQPAEFFLECCKKELPNFEVIYMMKGWEKSEGAKEELAEAKKRGMTIWYEDFGDTLWTNSKMLPFTALEDFRAKETALKIDKDIMPIEDCKPVNCQIKSESQEVKE